MARVQVEIRILTIPDEDGVIRSRFWSHSDREVIELENLPNPLVDRERAYLSRCQVAVQEILKEFDCAQMVEED